MFPGGKPRVPNNSRGDVASVVEKVGSKITKFKAGGSCVRVRHLDNSGATRIRAVTERKAARNRM